jgi:hypothetical protein
MNREGQPQILTNHSVATYPDVRSFPATDPNAKYNTFNRYRLLSDYLEKNREKKFTARDGFYAMSLVQGFTEDSSEGTAVNLPLRTLWPVVIDLDDCSMQVKFYTHDGPDKTLDFSKTYTFKLKR